MPPRRSGRLHTQRGEQFAAAKKHASKVRILNRKRKHSQEENNNMSNEMLQFEIQNLYVPVSETSGFNRSTIIPTPESDPPSPISHPVDTFSSFRFRNIFPCPLRNRTPPLPRLNWADPTELWQNMLKKELNYVRDRNCLQRHPHIDAHMRSILLDWLIEVCEVYHLHRETFFLAQDYVDRYLAQTEEIPKTKLQLIGITALFIASKLEEIYPPKLSDFAYVTDGACKELDILDQEILVLKALKWALSPITVNTWLTVYMQLAHTEEIAQEGGNFLEPKYSQKGFIEIAQASDKGVKAMASLDPTYREHCIRPHPLRLLEDTDHKLLDVCILDVGSWQFSYSTIAATALHLMSLADLHLTGLEWADISACASWMGPFASVIRDQGEAVVLKKFRNVIPDDSHNIQTHRENLLLLKLAKERAEAAADSCRYSPVPMATVLTPPQSSKKSRHAMDED